MGQKGGMLVPTRTVSLEPFGEPCVKLGPSCLGHAPISDLARQGVLDRVFAFALQTRAAEAADEPAGLEHAKVRRDLGQELVDGTRPKDAAYDGGGLQRFLLRAIEQIDA